MGRLGKNVKLRDKIKKRKKKLGSNSKKRGM
jgi:hypothetical protein